MTFHFFLSRSSSDHTNTQHYTYSKLVNIIIFWSHSLSSVACRFKSILFLLFFSSSDYQNVWLVVPPLRLFCFFIRFCPTTIQCVCVEQLYYYYYYYKWRHTVVNLVDFFFLFWILLSFSASIDWEKTYGQDRVLVFEELLSFQTISVFWWWQCQTWFISAL